MDGEIKIRQAEPRDAALLITLVKEFAAFAGITYLIDYELDILGGYIKSQKVNAFLAFDVTTGEVAGFALYVFTFNIFSKDGIQLQVLQVQEKFRRRGLAQRLIKVVAKVAVFRGFIKMEWCVMEDNTPARNLYAKIGATDVTEKIGWHHVWILVKDLEKLTEDTP